MPWDVYSTKFTYQDKCLLEHGKKLPLQYYTVLAIYIHGLLSTQRLLSKFDLWLWLVPKNPGVRRSLRKHDSKVFLNSLTHMWEPLIKCQKQHCLTVSFCDWTLQMCRDYIRWAAASDERTTLRLGCFDVRLLVVVVLTSSFFSSWKRRGWCRRISKRRSTIESFWDSLAQCNLRSSRTMLV